MCNTDVKKSKETARKSTKGKQRPAYKRRVKPPYSYVELITMAIKSSQRQMKTLREILDFMQSKFECFRGTYVGWKNSVRHNLSAAECFTKVLRNEQRLYGKDNYWTLNSDCSHCYNLAAGRPASQKRKQSTTNAASSPCSVASRSPSMASEFDSGFSESYSGVHDWVANHSPRVTTVSSSCNSNFQVQYIELRHTTRASLDSHDPKDISKFDFQSSVVPMTNFKSESNPYPISIARAPSSSSVTDSYATHSSGFGSCSDVCDLDMSYSADNLDTIMDDLFVPDNDIDLSLYGDWCEGGNQSSVTTLKADTEQAYNAGSPPSPYSTTNPLSPLSTSSVTSEIRTSITPQPASFQNYGYTNLASPNQEVFHQHQPSSIDLNSSPRVYQHHPQGATFYPSHNGYTMHATAATSYEREGWTSCSSGSPRSEVASPSLHSPCIIPTFESMLTSAVRGSLNLEALAETVH